MQAKKFVPFLLLILVLGAVSWWWLRKQTEPFYYAGTIEASKIDVPARIATVIAEVNAGEGSTVSQGQRLVRLECEDMKIQARLAQQELKRGQMLVKAGSIPVDKFDQLQARSQELDLRLSWCDVQAPSNGTVLTRYFEPGEWVSPGAKLFTLADLSQVWTYFYVAQAQVTPLRVGAVVSAYLPELGARVIKGRIVKINDEAEFTPKNVQTREERTRLVFGVKVQFDNADGLLKPGMPIESDLKVADHG
jgi:HlyD family secretion protein